MAILPPLGLGFEYGKSPPSSILTWFVVFPSREQESPLRSSTPSPYPAERVASHPPLSCASSCLCVSVYLWMYFYVSIDIHYENKLMLLKLQTYAATHAHFFIFATHAHQRSHMRLPSLNNRLFRYSIHVYVAVPIPDCRQVSYESISTKPDKKLRPGEIRQYLGYERQGARN